MPLQKPLQIELTKEEQAQLEHLARSWVESYGSVVRAKVILRLAAGESCSTIAREVGIHRRIVRKWGERFVRKRLAGLEDDPRSGRPARFSP